MPNIVTHGYITEHTYESPSTDLILGSTLPDFVGMNRDYMGGQLRVGDIQNPPDFTEGVAFHIKTDAVFDALPERLALLEDAKADCATNIPELPERVARTIANMGTDILMDVPVLDSPEGEELYRRLRTEVLAGRTALFVLGHGFTYLVERYFEEDRVLRYVDTEWLAGMINHRFSTRRTGSLAFDARFVLPVAGMLERQLQRIRSRANILLQETVETLQQS